MDSYWVGVSVGILHPPGSAVGFGISLGYKNYIVYEYSAGFFIHVTNISHGISSYPYLANIRNWNMYITPVFGLHTTKHIGYDYGGTLENKGSRSSSGFTGIALIYKPIILSIGYNISLNEDITMPALRLTIGLSFSDL